MPNTLNTEIRFNNILNIETNLLVAHAKIVTGYCLLAGKNWSRSGLLFKK